MLDIQDLSIRFTRYTFGLKKKETCVVQGLDLSIAPGQVMAVIGQSGAGKSLLAHALLGILPRNAQVEGRVFFKGKPLTPERLSTLRGREIALIPQSITALNPLLRVGVQVARAARLSGISKKDAPTTVNRAFSRYLLQQEVATWFPFQLSGGMARRVLTATATVGMADLILADEPTSGLDPITARETLGHLRELADTGKAVLLITHDIETALQIADMVTVFCAGTTVEVARADDFKGLGHLRHPYTRALWNALPANSFIGTMKPIERSPNTTGCPFQTCCNEQDAVCGHSTPELKYSGTGRVRCRVIMLEAKTLAYRYGKQCSWLFDDLDLQIAPGEIVGMSGPSGRGKSTLAKVLAGYLPPGRGSVMIGGRPLQGSGHCPVQLLFQHPELAVNPRWKVGKILREAEKPTADLHQDLGIKPAWLDRYPHELSGGELQRVCLVRALGAGTRYLLCDEMTSMLDALTQAHIWRIILDIARSRGLGLLVISHDTTLITRLCSRNINYFEDTAIH